MIIYLKSPKEVIRQRILIPEEYEIVGIDTDEWLSFIKKD